MLDSQSLSSTYFHEVSKKENTAAYIFDLFLLYPGIFQITISKTAREIDILVKDKNPFIPSLEQIHNQLKPNNQFWNQATRVVLLARQKL